MPIFILFFLLLCFPAEGRVISDVPTKPVVSETKVVSVLKGYPDVPEEHWARKAIDELVEAGVIDPGIGKNFWGDDPVDRFYLTHFLARLLEKLLLGPKGELELADSSLGYKDVNPINPAYRSIQKLIALGLLPPGFRQEVFRGDLLVNRYQLVYFLFNPIEQFLSPAITFEEAPSERGYSDVPKEVFAYSTIQKLINLGVLTPNGTLFEGEKPATRYWMAYLSVEILKKVYTKVKEKEEEIALPAPPPFGFKTLLTSNGSLSFLHAGKGTEDLLNISGSESISISIDRTLSPNFSTYLSLENYFTLGTPSTPANFSVGEAFMNFNNQPFALQFGRSTNYFSYSPFGASLILDNRFDSFTFSFSPRLGQLTGFLGKLLYNADITTDSNFAILLLNLNPFSFLEFTAGGSFVNDPLDPTRTSQLATQIKQTYGGAKINFGNFELSFENSTTDFSNPDVLPQIGTSDEVDTSASQISFTYNSPEFGYALSFGFQHLGDDFYNAGLSYPESATNSGPGKDAYLIKNRTTISENSTFTADLNLIYQQGKNIENSATFSYASQITKFAYLNLNVYGSWDPMDLTKFNQIKASAGISLSF